MKNSFFEKCHLSTFAITCFNSQNQSAEVLASRLQEKHLKAGTSVSFYGNREEKLIMYFYSDGLLVYCTGVDGLLLAMSLSV